MIAVDRSDYISDDNQIQFEVLFVSSRQFHQQKVEMYSNNFVCLGNILNPNSEWVHVWMVTAPGEQLVT